MITPEPLSSAPGEPAQVSRCAPTTRRRSPDPTSGAHTLRDGSRPGSGNSSIRAGRPVIAAACPANQWAVIASAVLPDGRGPTASRNPRSCRIRSAVAAALRSSGGRVVVVGIVVVAVTAGAGAAVVETGTGGVRGVLVTGPMAAVVVGSASGGAQAAVVRAIRASTAAAKPGRRHMPP